MTNISKKEKSAKASDRACCLILFGGHAIEFVSLFADVDSSVLHAHNNNWFLTNAYTFTNQPTIMDLQI